MITDEILDRAKNHYKTILKKPLNCIEVPEWEDENGNPTKVYFRSENTLDMDQDVAGLQAKGKHGEAAALALVQRARHEDGARMFKPVHAKQLARSVSSDVIVRIIDEMHRINKEDAISDEDLEKLNSSNDVYICFALAEALGKSFQEVASWDWDIIRAWMAYFKIKKRRSEKGY